MTSFKVPGSMAGLTRGCSSAGRAPALQAGCRRFDPDQLHIVFPEGRWYPVGRKAFFDKCIRRQNEKISAESREVLSLTSRGGYRREALSSREVDKQVILSGLLRRAGAWILVSSFDNPAGRWA
jgi:hypothetical protein